MPELPEVETVARQLRTVLIGKKIEQINISKPKSFIGEVKEVLNSPITAVTRRAKILRIQFANHKNVLIHLKMSGQLIYVDGKTRLGGGHPTADWINSLPSSHTRASFLFTDHTQIFFNDQRIFGWIKVATDQEVDQTFAKLAPDIIDPQVTPEYLLQKTAKRQIPIKQLIMDNQTISGVGNIYACDALNLAKILPTRPASSLSMEEIQRSLKSMREVIELGIAQGGATAHGKYVDVKGLAGKYQNFMRVYNRKGFPCPNCGGTIQKIKLAGRGTYFCPQCQK